MNAPRDLVIEVIIAHNKNSQHGTDEQKAHLFGLITGLSVALEVIRSGRSNISVDLLYVLLNKDYKLQWNIEQVKRNYVISLNESAVYKQEFKNCQRYIPAAEFGMKYAMEVVRYFWDSGSAERGVLTAQAIYRLESIIGDLKAM